MPRPSHARRRGPALLLVLGAPLLKAAAFLLSARRRPDPSGRLLVFQSYQVGDLFMALPALELLARHAQVTVACRPGCEGLLARRGLAALPFPHPWFASPSPRAFMRGLAAALALRGRTRAFAAALDLSGDPRTAFMLKAAGCARVAGPRRPYAWLFDAVLPLPPHGPHQGERDWAAASAWLKSRDLDAPPLSGVLRSEPPGPSGAPETGPWQSGPPAGDSFHSHGRVAAPPSPLLLACFTRKAEKNWPLDRWDAVFDHLLDAGRAFAVLDPPDGDEAFAAFRARWAGRVSFLAGDLIGVEDAVRAATGVIALDNFLGHMAASLGKPVLWINGSSDPAAVAPRGPSTLIVQTEPMPCRPCGNRCVNSDPLRCLKELPASAVIRHLRNGWPHAPRGEG